MMTDYIYVVWRWSNYLRILVRNLELREQGIDSELDADRLDNKQGVVSSGWNIKDDEILIQDFQHGEVLVHLETNLKSNHILELMLDMNFGKTSS